MKIQGRTLNSVPVAPRIPRLMPTRVKATRQIQKGTGGPRARDAMSATFTPGRDPPFILQYVAHSHMNTTCPPMMPRHRPTWPSQKAPAVPARVVGCIMEPMEDGLGLLPLHAHHTSSYLSDHLPAAASPESDAETTSAPADAPVQIGDYVRMHWTDLIVDGGTQPCDMYSVPARVIADSAVGFTAESLFSESSTLGYTEYDYRFDDEKDWGRIKMGDMVPSSLR